MPCHVLIVTHKANPTPLMKGGGDHKYTKCHRSTTTPSARAVHKIETQSTLLIVDEYQDRFKGIGKLVDFQVKLHVDPNVELVAQNYHRVPTLCVMPSVIS